MVKLNLLPPEQKEKKTKRKINFLLGLGTIFVFTLTGILIFILLVFQNNFNTKISKLDQDIADQKDQNAFFKKTSDEITKINKVVNALKNLDSKKIIWSENLKQIAMATPADLQITSISADFTKDEKPIEIDGLANSRYAIMRFKEKLEQSPAFSFVDFHSSNDQKDNNSSGIDFKLTCYLEGKTK